MYAPARLVGITDVCYLISLPKTFTIWQSKSQRKVKFVWFIYLNSSGLNRTTFDMALLQFIFEIFTPFGVRMLSSRNISATYFTDYVKKRKSSFLREKRFNIGFRKSISYKTWLMIVKFYITKTCVHDLELYLRLQRCEKADIFQLDLVHKKKKKKKLICCWHCLVWRRTHRCYLSQVCVSVMSGDQLTHHILAGTHSDQQTPAPCWIHHLANDDFPLGLYSKPEISMYRNKSKV